MTTATTDCQHERAISYTEDDQRYHGCRDCGAIIPIGATEQQPTPRPWTFRQLDEGGQRISNGHGPVGETYSPNDAALIVRAVNERDNMLDMLEELLSITEPLSDQMDHETREAWMRISATTADLRDGDEV